MDNVSIVTPFRAPYLISLVRWQYNNDLNWIITYTVISFLFCHIAILRFLMWLSKFLSHNCSRTLVCWGNLMHHAFKISFEVFSFPFFTLRQDTTIAIYGVSWCFKAPILCGDTEEPLMSVRSSLYCVVLDGSNF